jgi:lipase
VSLVVHELGDGEPFVCVHGLSAHGLRFRTLAERLRGRRLLCPDLRGTRGSTWEPPWDVETHVADLLDALPPEPLPWLGHSYGGRIVHELAHAAPERVSRLVLLDPALQLYPHVGENFASDQLTVRSFATAEEAIEHRIASTRFPRTPRERFEEDARDFLEPHEDGGLRYAYSAPAAIVAWSEMVTAPSPPARVPTLLVIAEDSHLVLDEHVDWLRAELGGLLAVERVPGGHTTYWDAPDETAAALRRFL